MFLFCLLLLLLLFVCLFFKRRGDGEVWGMIFFFLKNHMKIDDGIIPDCVNKRKNKLGINARTLKILCVSRLSSQSRNSLSLAKQTRPQIRQLQLKLTTTNHLPVSLARASSPHLSAFPLTKRLVGNGNEISFTAQ